MADRAPGAGPWGGAEGMAVAVGSGTRSRAGAGISPPDASVADEDHYQTLGVGYGATAAEITRAYRAAMKRAHPDRARPETRLAAEELARRLNDAYAVLSKPGSRQVYDRHIRARLLQDQIMSRYAGGFGTPGQPWGGASAEPLRRAPTAAETRARRQADRGAMVSIVVVFGGFLVAIVALLVVWMLIAALVRVLF